MWGQCDRTHFCDSDQYLAKIWNKYKTAILQLLRNVTRTIGDLSNADIVDLEWFSKVISANGNHSSSTSKIQHRPIWQTN